MKFLLRWIWIVLLGEVTALAEASVLPQGVDLGAEVGVMRESRDRFQEQSLETSAEAWWRLAVPQPVGVGVVTGYRYNQMWVSLWDRLRRSGDGLKAGLDAMERRHQVLGEGRLFSGWQPVSAFVSWQYERALAGTRWVNASLVDEDKSRPTTQTTGLYYGLSVHWRERWEEKLGFQMRTDYFVLSEKRDHDRNPERSYKTPVGAGALHSVQGSDFRGSVWVAGRDLLAADPLFDCEDRFFGLKGHWWAQETWSLGGGLSRTGRVFAVSRPRQVSPESVTFERPSQSLWVFSIEVQKEQFFARWNHGRMFGKGEGLASSERQNLIEVGWRFDSDKKKTWEWEAFPRGLLAGLDENKNDYNDR